jgi:TIR domain
MNQPVFISYRRETGHQLANLVASELQRCGYTTFLDVRRPEAGRFWDQIKVAIRNSRTDQDKRSAGGAVSDYPVFCDRLCATSRAAGFDRPSAGAQRGRHGRTVSRSHFRPALEAARPAQRRLRPCDGSTVQVTGGRAWTLSPPVFRMDGRLL